MEGARYGSDRPHEVQKDIRNTIARLGGKFPEVLVGETVQRKETRLKDHKSILKDYKNIPSIKKKCQDFSYNSPRVTDEDSGIWADTFTLGVKCHGCHRQTHIPETMTNFKKILDLWTGWSC